MFLAITISFASGEPLKVEGGQYDYRPGCEWYGREATQCSQDWYLYVYHPLVCYPRCPFEFICLGLFASSDAQHEYDVDPATPCAEFEVTGEFNWWFDATGSTSYLPATGVQVLFDWTQGPSRALAGTNMIASMAEGFGPLPFQLATAVTPPPFGYGVMWFRVCAKKVIIDAGFHGTMNVTTTMTFIYSA